MGAAGFPLKTRPTGTSNLTLEYTNDSFNFLLHPNKFPHLHVETENRVFCLVFFFFVFAPCGTSSVYLPITSEPPLLSKPSSLKKKRLTIWRFWQRFACSPLFPPIKKQKHHGRVWSISTTISSSQGAALLHCFPLIPLQPLGPLIRKQGALMFGPLADELYLWVVWEDAEECIQMCVCVCVCKYTCITKCAFPPLPPPKKKDERNTQHALCHTHLEARERCHSIQNRRATNRRPP